MPSKTTPSGYPYPLPTEPVRDGAAATKALADWLQGGPPEMQLSRSTIMVATNAGWTKLGWQNTLYQSASAVNAGMYFQGAGQGVVCPVGRYLVEGQVTFPAATGRRGIFLGPWGGTLPDSTKGPQQIISAITGNPTTVHLSGTVVLAAQDAITISVYQDSGADLTLTGTTFMLNVRRVS
jgi:hypothetical protein